MNSLLKVSGSVRSKTDLRLVIVILLLLECSAFFLRGLPEIFFKLANYNAKYLSSMVVAFVILVLFMAPRFRSETYLFKVLVLAFSAMCALTAFMSALFYSVDIVDAAVRAFPYIIMPLTYFALHSVVEDERDYSFLVEAAILIPGCYAVLCLVQATGAAIMNSDFQYMSYRADRLRLVMSGDVVAFGAAVALGRFVSIKQRRLTHGALLGVMLLELYWVAQTRFLLIGMIAVAGVTFLLKLRKQALYAAVLVVVCVGTYLKYYELLFAELLPTEADTSSVARINAYSYYMTHFYDMGIVGLGYVPDNPDSWLFGLVWDYYGEPRGDITDIGVVGFLARYGLAGLAVLVVGIWNVGKEVLRRLGNADVFTSHIEAWTVSVLFISISPTMAITDSQRIFFLPLTLLLVEHALTKGDLLVTASMRGCHARS